MATAPDKVLGMSDADFANLAPPEGSPIVVAPASGAEEPKVVEEPAKVEEPAPVAEEQPKKEEPGPVGSGFDPKTGLPKEAEPEKVLTDEEKLAAEEAKKKIGPDGKPIEEPAPKSSEPGAAPKGADLEPTALVAFYDQIMAPFKANGKTIELRDPKEAIALMQMGANYTKRMQDIQPHRKVLMMLESNGLLDEGKLSFLIDIEKKDPEAIKKLIKDSGIDPLEIDVATDPAYREGSHLLSDEEASFRSTIGELGSTDEGQKTLTAINADWDQASKEALWKSPEIMTVIHSQRESGVYDLIKTEVDRQMTLGIIPANTPFIQAYKTIGDEMAKAALGTGGEPKPEKVAEPVVVATRTETPKSPVKNGDKAEAASPTRSSPTATGEKQNPLAMSDEAFLKQFDGRL